MCIGASQGPVLALADTFHGSPPLVCLILKLAGDVVEANISLLEARLSSVCVWESSPACVQQNLRQPWHWRAHIVLDTGPLRG